MKVLSNIKRSQNIMTMIVDLLLYFITIFIIIAAILFIINDNIIVITFIVSKFFEQEQFTVLMR